MDLLIITHMCCTMAILTPAASDVPNKPHQPMSFSFPKRAFGQRDVVHCSF